jgi:AraC-like DNA-binding protein
VRAVHGMTPCHYLRALRLAEARQAFLCIDTPTTSVTEVALRCGFRELGRFAVDYRAKFGESPSDTFAARQQIGRPSPRLPPDQ